MTAVGFFLILIALGNVITKLEGKLANEPVSKSFAIPLKLCNENRFLNSLKNLKQFQTIILEYQDIK